MRGPGQKPPHGSSCVCTVVAVTIPVISSRLHMYPVSRCPSHMPTRLHGKHDCLAMVQSLALWSATLFHGILAYAHEPWHSPSSTSQQLNDECPPLTQQHARMHMIAAANNAVDLPPLGLTSHPETLTLHSLKSIVSAIEVE